MRGACLLLLVTPPPHQMVDCSGGCDVFVFFDSEPLSFMQHRPQTVIAFDPDLFSAAISI